MHNSSKVLFNILTNSSSLLLGKAVIKISKAYKYEDIGFNLYPFIIQLTYSGINLIKLFTNPLIYIFNNWIIFSTKFSSVDKVLKIYIKVGYSSKRISYMILLFLTDKPSNAEIDIDFNMTNNFETLEFSSGVKILFFSKIFLAFCKAKTHSLII